MSLWWLSYADDNGFRGACIVDGGSDIVEAARQVHRLGISPGGQVLGVPLDDSLSVPAEWRDRLLTKRDCAELETVMGAG